MHVYFDLIALAHGHDVTMEEVKSWAKAKCLSNGITEVFGDKVRRVKETSRLTVGEMVEFLARVEVETISEKHPQGIPLPDSEPFQLGVSHEEFRELRDKERARYIAMRP